MTVLGHAAVDRDLGLFENLSSGGFNVNCPGVNLINWYRNNGAGECYFVGTLVREAYFGRVQAVWNSPGTHDTAHDGLRSAS